MNSGTINIIAAVTTCSFNNCLSNDELTLHASACNPRPSYTSFHTSGLYYISTCHYTILHHSQTYTRTHPQNFNITITGNFMNIFHIYVAALMLKRYKLNYRENASTMNRQISSCRNSNTFYTSIQYSQNTVFFQHLQRPNCLKIMEKLPFMPGCKIVNAFSSYNSISACTAPMHKLQTSFLCRLHHDK